MKNVKVHDLDYKVIGLGEGIANFGPIPINILNMNQIHRNVWKI